MNQLRKTYYSFLLFLSLIIEGGLMGVENNSHYASQTGTLIVTYQTGADWELLDRIRFWVRDEKYVQQIYPKEFFYVDDLTSCTRMVVIEELLVGQYLIEFLIPNTDGLFKPVPVRNILIAKDSVVKIDQVIESFIEAAP